MDEIFPLLYALEELLERYRYDGGARYAFKLERGSRFVEFDSVFHLSYVFCRKKRSLGDSCSCTPEAPDMLSLLGELRDKLNREEVEVAGHRTFPSHTLSPFRLTGNTEQWKEMMKHVG